MKRKPIVHRGPFPDPAGNLELPSIAQVPTRSLVDVPWYSHSHSQQQQQQQPPHPHDHQLVRRSSSSSISSCFGGRLPSPSLPQRQLQALLLAGSTPGLAGSRSPSHGSLIGASSTEHADPTLGARTRSPGHRPGEIATATATTTTTAATGTQFPPSPPPDTPPFGVGHSPGLSEYHQGPYGHGGMDQPQTYLDLHQSHMSAGQPPTPQTTTAGSMAPYAQYGHPPLLQPVPGAAYPSAQSSFGQYPYANGVSSPQTAAAANSHVPAQLLPLPGMALAPYPCPCPRARSLTVLLLRRNVAWILT